MCPILFNKMPTYTSDIYYINFYSVRLNGWFAYFNPELFF